MPDINADADVRMIQAGDSFASCSKRAYVTLSERWMEDLDGDDAVQARVPRAYTSPMPPAPSGARFRTGRGGSRGQCHNGVDYISSNQRWDNSCVCD